jgi:hypothetical protein
MEFDMDEQVEADAALFDRIQYWKDFRTSATHLFPTDNAFRWFLRKHNTVLIAAGVLLKLPRGTYVDPGPFRALAINLMRNNFEYESKYGG